MVSTRSRLAIVAAVMLAGCSSGNSSGVPHAPSIVSSPTPLPTGLNVIPYTNVVNCDQAENQTTKTYYPGQQDYFGNTVQPGNEEVFHFIYDVSQCTSGSG